MQEEQARAWLARVHDLMVQLRQQWRRGERRENLSWPQWYLLRHLQRHGAAQPFQLADVLGVTRSTLTGLLDGLEEKGYARRRPDPEDRRAVRVEITGEGRRALERFERRTRQALMEALMGLEAEQAEILVKVMERFASAWSRAESSQSASEEGDEHDDPARARGALAADQRRA
ncbi:MarR family transcriptional regulator [Carboxydochorda subterranea]|uniref:MarR family transcriptional regulator n=1 Tax=Carboxydichorda subterranea TaxID=3109565 RepID=A0ABZ1BW04_9FIRM|nr:MarR family transcriptional regulator [Limnochorda sp. L945t]WRP16952.1 MarR family transcriptional regulator [Limnochorda sp. L945t]